MEEKKYDDFLKKAQEIADVIKDALNDQIKIISHLDTDGITAAGIVSTALYRAGASFQVSIIRQLEEDIMVTLSEGKNHVNLFIFTDLGSGQLEIIRKYLDTKKTKVVILDHHPPNGSENGVFQFNPHVFDINGSYEISGAGVSYFVAKAIGEDNNDLSALAVIGAIGDRQDKGDRGSLIGLNEKIVNDAVHAKVLELKKDLRLFGRATRPVHTALEYTTDPYIPGITGNRDACFKLLVELQIPLKKGDEWRTIAELTTEERTKLVSALITRSLQRGASSEEAQSIVGNVYTMLKEKEGSILRDAREFASCLNACGRMGRAGVGVALCMGDRGRAYKDAEEILSNYRTRLSDYLTLISENTERITDLKNVQIFDGKGLVDDRIIGTVVGLARSGNMLSSNKIVLGIALQEDEGFIKISGRSTEELVSKGISIGKALSDATENIDSAEAGGHDIAAGARVPLEKEQEFIKSVCENIDKQFAKLRSAKNDQAG
ncbi:MAG: DHHA1 domain-containing protein [Promethearchaeota archaeon]